MLILATLPAVALWLRGVFVAVLPSAEWFWASFPYLLAAFAAWVLLRRGTFAAHREWRPLRAVARIPGAVVASPVGLPLTIILIAVALFAPSELWVVYAVYIYAIVLFVVAGFRARRRARRIAAAREHVAVALGVPETSLEHLVRVRRDGVWVRPTARAREAMVNRAGEVDARLAAIHGHEAELRGDGWIVVGAASYETRERRDYLRTSDGLVLGVVPLSETDDPTVTVLELSAGISPARAEQVNAWAIRDLYGAELVEWHPFDRRATVRVLSERVRQVRGRLAELMRTDPWRLDVEITERDEHIETVIIRNAPSQSPEAARRIELWRQLVLTLPSGSNGWSVEEDLLSGTVTLTYGEPRALPDRVALGALLPDAPSTDWASIPLGVGETGEAVGIDLNLGPHGLYVGPTGSGKTIALLADAAQRLARGHDLVIIDPTKGGVDFASIIPYARGVATETVSEAAGLLDAVYAEGVRRKAVLKREAAVKWSDLPKHVREREDVRALSVLIDEVGSLLIAPEVPKALGRDDPRRTELEEVAAAKAGLRITIGNIARELRFVGIHLLLAVQRPDAAILSGELRSNLTSIVQLAKPGSLPSREALGMVFPGDGASQAYETLAALDTGRNPGLAVAAGDGGGLAGFRVAYAPMPEVPRLLAERGVPPANRAPLTVAAPAPTGPQFGRIIDDGAVPADPFAGEEVIDVHADLGAFSFGAPSPVEFDDLFE